MKSDNISHYPYSKSTFNGRRVGLVYSVFFCDISILAGESRAKIPKCATTGHVTLITCRFYSAKINIARHGSNIGNVAYFIDTILIFRPSRMIPLDSIGLLQSPWREKAGVAGL